MFLERRTMVLQYRISNYMSIGHVVEFKMISKGTQLETTREKLGVLYKSVLYGPEATGKSCFLDSIRFLRDFVLTGKWIRIERFAGDAKGMERKTTFQITFLAEGKIYEYGVTLDTRKILEEWLLIHNDTSFEPLFKRQITEIEGVFGKVSVKPRQLFLYVLAENGEQQIEPVVNWFQSIVIVDASDPYQMNRFKSSRGEVYLIDNVDQLSVKKATQLFKYFSNKGKECQVIYTAQESLEVVLVYKCRQKKLNSLYYKKKEQRRCSTWRKIKNRILRNSSNRSSISTMPEVPHILNWNMNMA